MFSPTFFPGTYFSRAYWPAGVGIPGLDLRPCGGVLLAGLTGGDLDAAVPDLIRAIPTCPEFAFLSPRRGRRPDTDQCPPNFLVIEHAETIVTPRTGNQRRVLTEASFDRVLNDERPGCRFRVVLRMRY